MAAILLLCFSVLVIISGITWGVIAYQRGPRDQPMDQFASGIPTDLIERLHHQTNDPAETDSRLTGFPYPFPTNPDRLRHPGRDYNEASYGETEYHKEEKLGDLPWD